MAVHKKEIAIAYLDILGFKNIVENESLEYIQEKILNEFEKNKRETDILFKDVTDKISIDNMTHEINVRMISDSVIIYCNVEYNESIKKHLMDLKVEFESLLLISYVWFLVRALFSNGILIRGGISHGECLIGENIVGAPYIEAYNLEEVQKWAGILISPKLMKFLLQSQIENEIEFIETFTKKIPDAPLKNTYEKKEYFPYFIDWGKSIGNIFHTLEKMSEYELSEKARKILLNTYHYYLSCNAKIEHYNILKIIFDEEHKIEIKKDVPIYE
ncbi:MAG: hypothetical protein ACTSW1_01015 [Candidatus Hodarchaeales archaeon]